LIRKPGNYAYFLDVCERKVKVIRNRSEREKVKDSEVKVDHRRRVRIAFPFGVVLAGKSQVCAWAI